MNDFTVLPFTIPISIVNWIRERIPKLVTRKYHKSVNQRTLSSDVKSKADEQSSCSLFHYQSQLYHKGRQIGKGAYKIIYEICSSDIKKDTLNTTTSSTNSFCRKDVVVSDQLNKKQSNALDRELYFGRMLAKVELAPQIYQIETCGEHVMMIMERMKENMQQVGKKQATSVFHLDHYPVLLFTVDQFQMMWNIIVRLSIRGIVHGDLKLENLMMSMDRNMIKVIDFGLTGDYQYYFPRWGFTHVYGCINQQSITPEIGIRANFWQFFKCLQGEVFVFIWDHSNQKLSLCHDFSFPDSQTALDTSDLDIIQNQCSPTRIISSLTNELKYEQRIREQLLDEGIKKAYLYKWTWNVLSDL